jgi:CRP-like cAMP-binding protein
MAHGLASLPRPDGKGSSMASALASRVPPAAIAEPFPLLAKLGSLLTLADAEAEHLRGLHEPKRKFPRHREIVAAGRHYDHVFILNDGFVSRYRVLSDGKRQVLNVGLPGDLIGFPACLFEVAVNSISSLTDVVVSPVSLAKLFATFTRFPRVGAALFWSSACDVATFGEHLVNLGRRSAYERLAHLIMELLVRLRAVGLAGAHSYTLPLTQELMADVLGLSGPHVNRMIRCLREEGLATIEDQRVVIHDLASLASLAGFEAGYLAPTRIPEPF